MADRNNYWTDKHETLCKMWLSADTKQQFKIYSQLTPALNYMIEIIQNRYFTIPVARQTEMKWDIVSHIYCVLHKYDPTKQKAFAWLGFVIKNKIYEMIDWNKPNIKYNKRIELEFCDELPEGCIEYPETPILDLQAFLKRITDLKKKWSKSMYTKKQLYHQSKIMRHNIYISKERKRKNILTILNLMEEYAIKFESIGGYAILDYIAHNSDMERIRIGNYFYELFGKTIRPLKDEIIRKDERAGYNYDNDDWTPDEDVILARQRKKNVKHRVST
jgi:hypothetical protein